MSPTETEETDLSGMMRTANVERSVPVASRSTTLRAAPFLFLLLVMSGCAGIITGRSVSSLIPPIYRSRVLKSLKLSGENRKEIENAITAVRPEHREGLCFILAYMPPVDLASVSSRSLLENVETAYQARSSFPWAMDVREDVFFHYVLPHRVTQEPLEDWRPFLLKRLKPIVENEQSMEKAAVKVNRWCGRRVRFGQTQWRDQGPFETLKSGYGRCEEMTILFICALRSVGIPARIASTPRWSTTDGNHAWAEIWVDGEWKFAGACEPAERLCQAWFAETAKRVALVYSLPYGIPEDTTDLYKKGDDFAIINSTPIYSAVGAVRVRVIDGGKAVPGEPMCLSVFNSGGLRPLALLKTDRNGEARMTVGDGTYFVSAGRQKQSWQIVEVKANQTSEVLLDLSTAKSFNSEFWLRYPPKELAR